ncbi:MAG: hypothetical protein GY696_39625, partial [Gammaproteobacteria bacterium]|nr:hypothetical protein [Gammaproteobacteria bacterium]
TESEEEFKKRETDFQNQLNTQIQYRRENLDFVLSSGEPEDLAFVQGFLAYLDHVTSPDPNDSEMRWELRHCDHGDISSKTVEKLLTSDGDFLTRRPTGNDLFVEAYLSVRWKGSVHNIIILARHGKVSLPDSTVTFQSIPQLLHHYLDNRKALPIPFVTGLPTLIRPITTLENKQSTPKTTEKITPIPTSTLKNIHSCFHSVTAGP